MQKGDFNVDLYGAIFEYIYAILCYFRVRVLCIMYYNEWTFGAEYTVYLVLDYIDTHLI